MAKVTKDLRQATVLLLESTRKKIQHLDTFINRARTQSVDSCRYSITPNKMATGCYREEKTAICTGICKFYKNSTEEWIIISWELEQQLLENQIQTLEKWIIEDKYDY